jgi:hypothetical protein
MTTTAVPNARTGQPTGPQGGGRVIPAGGHQLVLGEVIDIEQRHPSRRPLVFVEGRMTRLDPTHVVGPHLWELG